MKNEQAAMLNTKGMRFPVDVILVCIRGYAAYPLSYRHLEEIMQERGVMVDHSSINRWAIGFLPLLEKAFRKHRHAVGTSWRMDETSIKVNGPGSICIGQSTRQARQSFSVDCQA
jgi:putative transposase